LLLFLLICVCVLPDAATFDRRARKGANSASDIWSLGCLFFELLTGEFLFYDDDWVKFFLRVTQGTEVLTADKQVVLLCCCLLFVVFVIGLNRLCLITMLI
jgi:hypothetical protein